MFWLGYLTIAGTGTKLSFFLKIIDKNQARVFMALAIMSPTVTRDVNA